MVIATSTCVSANVMW